MFKGVLIAVLLLFSTYTPNAYAANEYTFKQMGANINVYLNGKFVANMSKEEIFELPSPGDPDWVRFCKSAVFLYKLTPQSVQALLDMAGEEVTSEEVVELIYAFSKSNQP